MENWLNDLLSATNNIIYSQWATLGANVAVAPCERSVVDPEALVVATCAFGRYDARIFDEAMDWTLGNHGLLKPWRLKKIARSFGGNVQRTLGAVLSYLEERENKGLFPGVQSEARAALDKTEVEPLFWKEASLYRTGSRKREPVFAEWKLLRAEPRIRMHSKAPDMRNPGNLMTRLRKYYGTGAKADVITYLLTGKGGSSKEIAHKVEYNQKSVYEVLEDLVAARMAQKRGGRGNAYYWVDAQAIARSIGLKGKRPVFFVWGDLFQALDLVAEDLRTHKREYASRFFAAERSRKLAVEIAPIISKSGEPLEKISLPDIRASEGAEHTEELFRFISTTLDILARFLV